jgi:hypothetical protein
VRSFSGYSIAVILTTRDWRIAARCVLARPQINRDTRPHHHTPREWPSSIFPTHTTPYIPQSHIMHLGPCIPTTLADELRLIDDRDFRLDTALSHSREYTA